MDHTIRGNTLCVDKKQHDGRILGHTHSGTSLLALTCLFKLFHETSRRFLFKPLSLVSVIEAVCSSLFAQYNACISARNSGKGNFFPIELECLQFNTCMFSSLKDSAWYVAKCLVYLERERCEVDSIEELAVGPCEMSRIGKMGCLLLRDLTTSV